MSDVFPFKMEALLEQCGGSKEVGDMVLDEFLVQAEADIRELEGCVASGDTTQAGKVGHRLKGTAGVLGALKLHSLCIAVETAGKTGNTEEVAKAFAELKDETEQCVAAVPEARNRLG